MPRTCCFVGHRTIHETAEWKEQLSATIEKLILQENVDTFLFGSKSRFNDLCHELVTQSKEKHPHIKRVYVRAEHPHISEHYQAYLLQQYEDTYFPPQISGAGKAAYVERNCEMIRKSDFCVVYFRAHNVPANRKSGAKAALDYAVTQKKHVIIV